MVQDQGFDVYLAPFSDITKRYPEYTVPANFPVLTRDANEVYIEAVDGERFVIVVDLLKNFNARQGKMLVIGYDADGEKCTSNVMLNELLITKPRGSRLKGRKVLSSTARKVDGRWVACGFAFAPLRMDENMELDADQVARSIDLHGKIIVKLRRGNCIKTSSKDAQRRTWNGYQAPDTDASSKEIVSDNHVSHAIRHVALHDTQQPSVSLIEGTQWKALDGQGGDAISFTIRYRSRDALQKLKIIPKDKSYIDLTTSPPPSPRVKREPQNEIVGAESTGDDHIEKKVKQDPADTGSREQAKNQSSASASRNISANGRISKDQRAKERKVMQDKLREVELERESLRLRRKLAQMDESET